MSAIAFAAVAAAAAALAPAVNAQVTATGTMGTTNPAEPTYPTTVNQSSYSRLLSINSIDDFCIFAPPVAGDTIGDTEAEQVAWCVQPRNDARVIPDGVLQAVHFVKTPLYVQVQGWGDFTHINILDGDEGGELDPHGATGLGNPVGGNVTSNITGSDVNYEEWMNYMSYEQFCIRVCISENSTYSAAEECQHTLDEMGCNWVMPGDYTNNSFTSCDGDSAYPPGLYPESNGSTSTFQQRYTGTYTDADGQTEYWTQGYTVTPQTAYSTPATSNCVTYSSVGNGIASLALANAGTATGASGNSTEGSSTTTTAASSGATATLTGASTGSKASTGSAASTGKTTAVASDSSAATSSSAAMSAFAHSENFGTLMAASFSAFALVAGAGALLL